MRTRRCKRGGCTLSYRSPARTHCYHLRVDVVAMATTKSNDDAELEPQARETTFDTDSVVILIDIGASACITNDLADFLQPPTNVSAQVTGISRQKVLATKRGTVAWRFEDDNRVEHRFVIRNVYYVPDAPHRILCPQQWAQQAHDQKPMAEGTGCMTTSKHVVLFWDQRRYRKSIPLDTKLNIGFAKTASGYKRFATFMANVAHNWEPETEQVVFETHIIPVDESTAPRQLDDDDMSFQPPDPVDPPTTTDPPIRQYGGDVPATTEDLPTTSQVDFALPDKPHVIPDDEEPRTLTPHDELLRWHYRLGHVSFRRIQLMAKRNELPKKLFEAKIPLCPACQYGKMIRRPWRTKPQQTGKQVCTVTAPGQVVSVDQQLESTTVGFIGQLKGILTTRRYKYAKVKKRCAKVWFMHYPVGGLKIHSSNHLFPGIPIDLSMR